MAKKWSDVAASAAFQALSFEEQEEARRQYFEQVIAPRVPEQDVSIALAQFLSDTELKRVPSLDTQPIDYSDAATAMMGTPAPAPTQGLIQRIGQALRPAPKSVLDEPPSPELLAESQRAERDRRLSYGAGPIRPEVVAEADRVRSTRGTRSAVQPTSPTTERVVRAMDERGEESSADIIERVSSSGIRQAATQAKAEEFRSLGEWAVDTLSSVSQGAVSLAQLPTNIIAPGSALAENLRQVQKELQAEESDVAKASREVLRRRVESEEGFLGKYFATVKELVTNPTLSINEAIKQVPMFIGVVGAAKLGATAAGAGVTAAGRAAPTVALADAIGGGALTTTARAAGSTIGGVGASMVMAGGDAAGNTYETLTDKAKTPLSEWQKNPDYQKLVADGKTSDEAIQEIATAKARLAAVITAPLGILGFMGAEAAVAGRGVARAAMGAATPMGAARLLAKENITEQLEEGGTQFLSNVATSTVRQDQNLLEGVPEAMAAAAVTSTPFGALGAYSQYRQAKAEGASDPVAESIAIERLSPGGTLPISPAETMRAPTDVGPAPRPGVANFTPTGSPTQQAGMVDIVVPLPAAPGDQALGDLNVSTTGAPGGLVAGGGLGRGGFIGGGMGAAGPGDLAAAGAGGGVPARLRTDAEQALPVGGGAGQPLARLSRPLDRATDVDLLARAEAASAASPSKIWAGRAGDGYMQPQDAQQALPGLQRKYPDLAWDLRQDADGKFFWAGTTKGANLETTATPTAGAQGQEVTAAGALAGQGQAAALPAGTAAGGAAAATQLPGLEAAGLRVAPTAPISEIKKLNTALSSEIGVTVSPVNVSDMSDQQKLASAVARLMGKTLTVVRQETGTNLVPNGMINRLGGKHIYVAEDTEDAPLFVAVHEAYHGLPEDKRQVLNKALLETFRAENKQAFLDEFGYDPAKFDEEAPAMIAQVVSKREDFWQDLRTKMGNKEFGEVAKVILSKLSEIVTGARAQYGDDFVKKYITDIEKARDLLSTAYADAMKAQGLQPDVEVSGGVMASNRAADVNKLGMYSELARKLEAGPNQAPVDQWKAYIKGLPQKGVKPDEIEWSGVEDFLELKRAAGQKVTKAEVAEYLKQGGVQVEETVLSDEGATDLPAGWRVREATEDDDAAYRYVLVDDNNEVRGEGATSAEAMADGWDPDAAAERPTKYSQYTLPGGENYREVLLTLPQSPEAARLEQERDTLNATSSRDPRYVDLTNRIKAAQYKSTHWDQPNVLAHIRVNDRTDADGNRVLFVEELQSDWGQEGKKKGFKGKTQEDAKRFFGISDADWNKASEEDREAYRLEMLDAKGRDIIPAAPFVTKTEGWLNLALKRVMILAAEGDYDKVAFVNGEQSADRYDLSKQVSRIVWNPETGNLYATPRQGEERIERSGISAEKLPDIIGKEAAERLVSEKARAPNGTHVLKDGELKVGGEGMKTFYDTIVPTALKKLLPKVGGGQMAAVSIGSNRLEVLDDPSGQGFIIYDRQTRTYYRGGASGSPWSDDPYRAKVYLSESSANKAIPDIEGGSVGLEQPGFDITPAMREKVATSGLPMFSQRAKEDGAAGQAAAPTTESPERKPRRGTEAVGDFDVRTMKDGTIVVYGDADAIRAQIPDDVKGRVTKDGIAFTNASAPRVRAALAGRKTAYSRGGEVVEKLPMKDGKYLGAPEKYNTPGKIVALRKQLRKLTIEGERGRYWYENSSKAILRMTGGNVQEARKFVALLAIYSPQVRVDSNSTFALRAWAQYKAGQPISVKTVVQDKKATEAMADVDAFWSGEKTGNFFFNLLREIDPSTAGKQGATIDMWMMRAAEYDNDVPTATQYAFMENETNRIAQEMGWEPQQVQAAIWVAMKARMENKGVKEMTEATSEKKGWIRFERNAKGKKERVILNKQKHRDNWLKHAMEHVPTKEDTEQAKFDFADGVGRHIGQLSFEARPGRSTGVLDGIHSAPYAQQIEFQQALQSAFYDENGADMLALQLGLLSEPSDIMRPGVWQGEVSPSTQKRVAMAPAGGDAGKSNVDPAQAKLLNVYASVAGLVARQEGVGWHRPFYAGTKRDSNGLDIDIGRALNPAETKDLEAAIGKWMADNGHKDWQNSFALISSPTGIRAVNFGIITNDVLQSEIVKVAEGVLPNFDYRVFASSGDMPTNDWKEFPNGQSYVQRIGAEGRSDVLEWARSVLAPRVQRVFEQFAEKYQWGDPGRIQFSNRAGDGSRGQGVGGAQDRTVQASDAAVQQEALSPLPGAPQVRGFTGPDPQLVAVAEKYARDNGITLRRQAEYAEVDPLRAKRIANAYEVMRHAPQDPKVKEAYENLIRQTVDQYKALADAGYKFWFIDLDKAENAEYASTPWNAMRDIRANKQMGVFPTAGGFGSGATELNVDDNPLLQDTGFRWPVGGLDGRTAPVLANDLFRAVHDAFGHGLEGAGFRAQGEENAWQAHVRLFTGSAVGAITSETRGQNSWLNYGPYGEKNRTAKVEDTVFADQKTGLMPEWTWTEGRVGDMPGITASKRARTDTPEFKRWFGDSKVVDENGEPLVVYHGTTRDFSQFSEEAALYRGGILAFFSTSPKFGSGYAGENAGANVMPVYLRITDPFDFRKNGAAVARDFYDSTGGLSDQIEINRIKIGLGQDIDLMDDTGPLDENDFAKAVSEGAWYALEAPQFVEWLRESGYDGIVTRENGAINYAVFEPTQIKSATGNRGTFDPENPDIRFSNRAAKPELDADVVSIFRDLDGARGLALIRARERVDAHPMAETIRRVNDEFLDILERLDDAGLVKINCT